MDESFSLSQATVGIVGLGLMGGSLALALKGRCRSVLGCDTDPSTVQAACDRAALTLADQDPARVLPRADIIILATPVPAILALLRNLPAIVPNGCVVLDVGSVKRSVISAMNALPQRFEPIGGHPLCGKEKLSFVNAEENLYRGASFFLTPLERTTPRALSAAHQLIEAIGAKPISVSPEEHDRYLAQTSHMPFLLSSALALGVDQECARFAGPGFRSTSRLAGTATSMMLGILQSNRDNILEALQRIQSELAEINGLLSAQDYIAIEELLNTAQSRYQALVQ